MNASHTIKNKYPTRLAGRGVRAPLALFNRSSRFSVLAVPVAATVIFCWPMLGELLEFSRPAILHGQYYRLLTGHLTHFTAEHMLWDTLTLLVLGMLVAKQSSKLFWWTLLGSATMISLAILAWLTQMEIYRGLSGIDSAMFTCAAIQVIRRTHGAMRWLATVAILGFMGKTFFELWTGQAIFVQNLGEGVSPVILAHLIGALWGAVMGMWEFRFRITPEGHQHT